VVTEGIQKFELNRPGFGPGDEPAKMARAGIEGAAIGPAPGSLEGIYGLCLQWCNRRNEHLPKEKNGDARV